MLGDKFIFFDISDNIIVDENDLECREFLIKSMLDRKISYAIILTKIALFISYIRAVVVIFSLLVNLNLDIINLIHLVACCSYGILYSKILKNKLENKSNDIRLFFKDLILDESNSSISNFLYNEILKVINRNKSQNQPNRDLCDLSKEELSSLKCKFLYFLFVDLVAITLMLITSPEISFLDILINICFFNFLYFQTTCLKINSSQIYLIIILFSFVSTTVGKIELFFNQIIIFFMYIYKEKYDNEFSKEVYHRIKYKKSIQKTLESIEVGIFYYSYNKRNQILNEHLEKIINQDQAAKVDENFLFKEFKLNKDLTKFPLNKSFHPFLKVKNDNKMQIMNKEYSLHDVIVEEESTYIKDNLISNDNKLIYLGLYNLSNDDNRIYEIYKTPYKKTSKVTSHSNNTPIKIQLKSQPINPSRNETSSLYAHKGDRFYNKLLPSRYKPSTTNLINTQASKKTKKMSYMNLIKGITDSAKKKDSLKNSHDQILDEIYESYNDSSSIDSSEVDDEIEIKNDEQKLLQEFEAKQINIQALMSTSECIFFITDVTKVISHQIRLSDIKYQNIINSKMAHEIKTPCIAVNSYLDKIENLVKKSFQNKKKTQIIMKEIFKARTLVDQIINIVIEMCDYTKDISKCEVVFEDVSLYEQINWGYWFLSGILNFDSTNPKKIKVNIRNNLTRIGYANKSNNSQDRSIENMGLTFKTDMRRFKIILSEAIKNAIKNTFKGEISFILNETDTGYTELLIEDTGCGISREKLDEINEILDKIQNDYNAPPNGRMITSKNQLKRNSLLIADSSFLKAASFGDLGGLNLGLQFIKIYCLKLGIEFQITSKSGQGTSLSFKFSTTLEKSSFERLLDIKPSCMDSVNSLQNYEEKIDSRKETTELESRIEKFQKKKSFSFKKSTRSLSNIADNMDEAQNQGSVLRSKDCLFAVSNLKEIKEINSYEVTSTVKKCKRKESFHPHTNPFILEEEPSSIPNNEFSYDESPEAKMTFRGLQRETKNLLFVASPIHPQTDRCLSNLNSKEFKEMSLNLEKSFKSENSEKNEVEDEQKSKYLKEIITKTAKNSRKSVKFANDDDHESKKQVKESNSSIRYSKIPDDKGNLDSNHDIFRYTETALKSSSTLNLIKKGMNSRKDTKNQISSNKEVVKILVVDDDYFCRKNLKNLIKTIAIKKYKDSNLDIQTVKAIDGIDTLNTLLQDQTTANQFKLVISDENMNFVNGSDSFMLLNRMFDVNKLYKIPLLILTALEDKDALAYIKKYSKADEILRKPLNRKVLEEKLLKYIPLEKHI